MNLKWRHHGNVDLCDDCKRVPPVVTWGLGTVRCQACSDAWAEKVRAENQARFEAERKAYFEHVKVRDETGECPDDGELCNDCCDHEYDSSEGYTCLNCGDDGCESVLAAAYDRAKDIRKYGA